MSSFWWGLGRATAIARIAAVVTFTGFPLAALAAFVIAKQPFAPPGPVTLVYVGAEDCAPCKVWKRDREPALQAAPFAGRLNYEKVISPQLSRVLSDENWPEHLRPLRSRFEAVGGVPAWLVTSNGKVVVVAGGADAWDRAIMPALRFTAH